ncbi:hypothetical protein C1922_18805 [Stenotrophomonas sp. ZAC14D2_NAIMI4_7]|uniref:hypothetical protein n=1 Tax=Stenotrophomonas maltophilia group TaxID=995085 RepID=UPI000D53D931|nr:MULTISPECIES: hypothetical protein [Stenotrophomonas maltophilia group]AWH19217.1 hypothetical protein C1922_18805 [Stenotrophomonas sp. ZAC14D2_NAIMI4_7]
MQGKDLRDLLEAHPNAKHHLSDANDYLVSYRFDTGTEVAFDPRTVKMCSVFLAKMPPAGLYHPDDLVIYEDDDEPSSALRRVSTKLASTRPLYRVKLKDPDLAKELLDWARLA